MGTYRAQPGEGHEGMTIGLEQFRDQNVERLPRMLLLPFTKQAGDCPLNRRGNGVSLAGLVWPCGEGRPPRPLFVR